jgi:probable HAF family extracellular repeat protein
MEARNLRGPFPTATARLFRRRLAAVLLGATALTPLAPNRAGASNNFFPPVAQFQPSITYQLGAVFGGLPILAATPLNTGPIVYYLYDRAGNLAFTNTDRSEVDYFISSHDPLYGAISPLGTNPNNSVHAFGLGFGTELTAVGWSDRDAPLFPHAFMWTLSGGTVDLGVLPGTPAANDTSYAYGISADASVIVGQSGSPRTVIEAFRYTTADHTMRDLGTLSGVSRQLQQHIGRLCDQPGRLGRRRAVDVWHAAADKPALPRRPYPIHHACLCLDANAGNQ